MAVRKVKGSWWVDFQVRGRRYRLRSPDNHRDGAVAYEHVIRRRLADDKPVYLPTDPRSRTLEQARPQRFAAFASEWFETYVKTNLKPSTQRGYAGALARYILPYFGRYEIDAITTELIETFKARGQRDELTAKTINNALSVLRRALTEAMEWGLLEKLPRFKFLKTAPPTFDFLHPSESDALMSAVTKEPWRTMVRCALRTGMRFGELLGLRWEDVDFERNVIVVRRNVVDGNDGTPKNNRFRMIPMAPSLRDELRAMPRRADRVFVLADGRTPNRWSAIEALERACERAGLRRIGWHVLRHGFASQLVGAGVNLAMIQALLGHSTLEMTMRYAHVSGEHLRNSIEALERGTPTRGVGDVSRPSTDGERSANEHATTDHRAILPAMSLCEPSRKNTKHSAVGGVL